MAKREGYGYIGIIVKFLLDINIKYSWKHFTSRKVDGMSGYPPSCGFPDNPLWGKC